MTKIKHIKVIVCSDGKITVRSKYGIDSTTMEMIHDEMMKCLNEVLGHIESEAEFKVTMETGKKPDIESIGLLTPEEVEYIAKTFKKCFNNLLSQEVRQDG